MVHQPEETTLRNIVMQRGENKLNVNLNKKNNFSVAVFLDFCLYT